MRRFVIMLLVCILILSLVTEMYTTLSILLTLIVFYNMLDKFGKGIVLLETMAFYSCIIYLVMPLIGYTVYTRDNRIAVLWQRVMLVPYDTYYSFILPAITTYIIGLFLLNSLGKEVDKGHRIISLSDRIKAELSLPGKRGIVLIITGICFYFIKSFAPTGLAAIAAFGYMLIFPGLLYIYFQPKFKGKIWVYILVALFFMKDAVNSGMFTITIYMSLTIVSFFLVGRKIRLPVKLIVVVSAVCAVFILQIVKGSFRKSTWKGNYAGSKSELFQDMFLEKAGNFNEIFSADAFFPIYVRLNQGFTTSMVMRRIPMLQPYDGGSSIIKVIAASMVPRFMWPDKPEAGGVYNMKHFAGFTLVGWSTNIGPVGEGYGNFGITGGIIYMFLFGLFIGWAYGLVFKLSVKTPLFVLWIPLLFYEVTFAMENDTLQALNSLIKAAIFLWLLNKVFPNLFAKTRTLNKKSIENRAHIRDNRTGWSLPG